MTAVFLIVGGGVPVRNARPFPDPFAGGGEGLSARPLAPAGSFSMVGGGS